MNGLGWAQVAPPQDTAKHRAYQIERKGYVFSSSSRGRGFVGKADFWLGEKEKSRLLPLKRKWKKCEKVESGYDRKIFPPAETWKVKEMGKSRWESGMAENPHTHRGEMCGVEKRSGGGYIRFEKENAAGDKRDFAPFHRASSTKKEREERRRKKGRVCCKKIQTKETISVITSRLFQLAGKGEKKCRSFFAAAF